MQVVICKDAFIGAKVFCYVKQFIRHNNLSFENTVISPLDAPQPSQLLDNVDANQDES